MASKWHEHNFENRKEEEYVPNCLCNRYSEGLGVSRDQNTRVVELKSLGEENLIIKQPCLVGVLHVVSVQEVVNLVGVLMRAVTG